MKFLLLSSLNISCFKLHLLPLIPPRCTIVEWLLNTFLADSREAALRSSGDNSSSWLIHSSSLSLSTWSHWWSGSPPLNSFVCVSLIFGELKLDTGMEAVIFYIWQQMNTLVAPPSFLSQLTQPLSWRWRKSWQFHSRADWVSFLTKKTNSALWSTYVPSSAPADPSDSMHLVCELEPEPDETHPCRDTAYSGNLLLGEKIEFSFFLEWTITRRFVDSLLPICHPFSISMREHSFLLFSSGKDSLKKMTENIWKLESFIFVFYFFPHHLFPLMIFQTTWF